MESEFVQLLYVNSVMLDFALGKYFDICTAI